MFSDFCFVPLEHFIALLVKYVDSFLSVAAEVSYPNFFYVYVYVSVHIYYKYFFKISGLVEYKILGLNLICCSN